MKTLQKTAWFFTGAATPLLLAFFISTAFAQSIRPTSSGGGEGSVYVGNKWIKNPDATRTSALLYLRTAEMPLYPGVGGAPEGIQLPNTSIYGWENGPYGGADWGGFEILVNGDYDTWNPIDTTRTFWDIAFQNGTSAPGVSFYSVKPNTNNTWDPRLMLHNNGPSELYSNMDANTPAPWGNEPHIRMGALHPTNSPILGLYKGVAAPKMIERPATQAGKDNTTAFIYRTTSWPSAGTLDFDWIVSTEQNYDFLWVDVDAARVFTSSGENQGNQSIPVTSGSHTIKFTYRKDSSGSNGYDTVKVWNVNFLASGTSFEFHPNTDSVFGSIPVGWQWGYTGYWYGETQGPWTSVVNDRASDSQAPVAYWNKDGQYVSNMPAPWPAMYFSQSGVGISGVGDYYLTTDDQTTGKITINAPTVEMGGDLKLAATATTCDASNRSKIHTAEGTTGVADKVEVCVKDALDAYAWIDTLGGGSGGSGLGALVCTTGGEIPKWSGSEWACAADATGAGGVEDDPQVASLVDTKWCTSNGTAVNCTSNAPVLSESDPSVNALGKATLSCTTDQTVKWGGSAWACSDFQSGSETDPTVNALGKATLSCSTDQIAKWNGSAWACAADATGAGGVEDDPQVGTLTDTKWCTSNGTTVNCTSDAPTGGTGSSDFSTTVTVTKVPLSYWKLDESSGAVIDFNGVLNLGAGVSTVVTGKYGNARTFTSAASSSTAPAAYTDALKSGNFAVELWLKDRTTGSWQGFFALTPGVSNEYMGLFVQGNGIVYFEGGAGSDYISTADAIPQDTDWHHVVVNGLSVSTTQMRVTTYVDGVLKGSGATLTKPTSTDAQHVSIGCMETTSYCFPGSIDNVRFFDQTLSETDVLGYYNNGRIGVTIAPTGDIEAARNVSVGGELKLATLKAGTRTIVGTGGVMSYFPFNDSTRGTYTDTVGGVVLGPYSGTGPTVQQTGHYGYAVGLDGYEASTAAMGVVPSSWLTQMKTGWSWEGWNTNDYPYARSLWYVVSNNQVYAHIGTDYSGHIIYSATGVSATVISTATITDGLFHHVAVTAADNGDGNLTLRAYIDSVGQTPVVVTKPTATDTSAPYLVVGRGSPDVSYATWVGKFDNFRWYNAALEESEVTTAFGSVNGATGGVGSVVVNALEVTKDYTVKVAYDLQLGSSTTTCNSENRRRIRYVDGTTGVSDHTEICMKSAADTYSWVTSTTAP